MNMPNIRKQKYTDLYNESKNLSSERYNAFLGESQVIASDDNDISKFLAKTEAEKTLFRIEDELGTVFENNIIQKFNKKSFSILNPYLIQLNQSAPENLFITIQSENYEFKFSVHTEQKSALNRSLILTVSSDILKHQKRVLNRIEPSKTIPVGLYSIEKQEEFVGEVMDITTLGIGLLFDEGFFDMDLFNELKNSPNTKLPIILAVDEEFEENGYLGLMIVARHVEKSDGKVIIGADFLLNSSQENTIINLVEELKQQLNYKKRHDLTLQIIKNSSYGV